MKVIQYAASAIIVSALLAPVLVAQSEQVALPGAWRMSPYADLKLVYDDNVGRVAADEQDDIFADLTAGLRLGYSGSSLRLLATGFVGNRSYDDYTDRDFSSAGQSLLMRYGARDQFELEVRQALRRIEDTDTYDTGTAVGNIDPNSVLDAASSTERTILQASVRAGKNLTDKSEMDVGYRFDSVDYEEDVAFSQQSHAAQLEAASKITDKTSALVLLTGGQQSLDDFDDEADVYSASLGIKTKGTDKLTLRATGGYQQYERSTDEDTVDSFLFGVSGGMPVTDKLSLQVGARNGTQLSSILRGNATEYQTGWVATTLHLTSELQLSAKAAYREDDYIDPVLVNGAGVNRKDEGTSLSLRADYLTPSEYLRLYADISYTDVDSNVQEYAQTRAGVGMSLQF